MRASRSATRPWLRWLVFTVVVVMCCSVSCVQSRPCDGVSVRDAGVQLAKVVCFITASSEHYDYESLRTGMCSHVVLIDLVGVGKDGCLELLQASSRSLNRFTEMKLRFSEAGDEAKFIVSIGGVAQKSSHFSKALKTVESRLALSDELISFNIKHGLDGIDIAWFYPAQFGGVESDRANLVVFLRDLNLRTKACDISLSLTAGVDPKDIELSYDVPRINELVDFVNLLTGDYHNPTAPTHISPLYGQSPRDRLNINYSVTSFIEAGLNPRKIVILNSCYAYLYISKINKNETDCPTKLRTVMRLSFLSAREIIIRESFQTSWDDMRHVPYGTVTNGITKKWITYSDVESVRRKADYVLHHQLGGMGLFSVDEDDFAGRAGCGRYPMLRTIVAVLYPELACDEMDEEVADVETIVCPYNGYLVDPVQPEYYYVCEQGVDLQECPKQRCPQGEVFDEAQNSCCQQTYPVQELPVSHDYYEPISQYPEVAPQHYMSPVDYAQPNTMLSAGVPSSYPPLPQYYGSLPVQIPTLQIDPIQKPYIPHPAYVNVPPKVELSDLLYSPSTIAPSICEPQQQPSNIISHVVINPNSMFNSGDYVGSASTVAPVITEPIAQPSNVRPMIHPNVPFDVEYYTTQPTATSKNNDLAQQASNVQQVIITPKPKVKVVEETTDASSTTEAPQFSELIQQPSNTVPKVEISPNSVLGEPIEQDDQELLVTPKPAGLEPNMTDPIVLVTPKVRNKRPSKKSSSGRRRSRTRSHSSKAAAESDGRVNVTTTEAAPSESDPSTIHPTSTRERNRARRTTPATTGLPTTTQTTTLSSAPATESPTTTTTTTSTTTTASSTTTTTEPPTSTTTTLEPSTSTLAVTESSTTAVPSSRAVTSNSSSRPDNNPTLSPSVTQTDKTTVSSTTPAPARSSNTRAITTATTAANATETNDTASHLVTTVT